MPAPPFPPCSINDSYERVNDNEVSESLRNKVTLIVEAESVLPYSLYRTMLEQLARRDLYVIKVRCSGGAQAVRTHMPTCPPPHGLCSVLNYKRLGWCARTCPCVHGGCGCV